jgi:putative oxidoreductase
MGNAIASCEGQARSVLRIILAFTISLHGYREVFGWFPVLGGRRGVGGMALDSLPSQAGFVLIAGGLLLFLGLFTRPVVVVLCVQLVVAYFYAAAPRSPWPIRNGGEEVVLYFLVFVYLALAGGGPWSLDQVIQKKKGASLEAAGATT